MNMGMTDRIKKTISTIAVMSMLFQICTVSYATSENRIILDTPTVNGSSVGISGEISSGKQCNLLLKVKQGENEVYSENILTDEDGGFVSNFTIPQTTSEVEYSYQIEEISGDDIVETLFEDDFSTSTKSYTVKGTINSETGKPAPSVYLASNERQLKQLSDSPEGTIDIYGDFFVTSNSSNTILLTATASQGDARGIDTSINKTDVFNAFEVRTSGGDIILKYADNATSQQTVVEKTMLSDFEDSRWYNIRLVINTNTLELKSYIDGAEVLSGESKYIFKQLEYKRIFDTKKTTVPMYVDNIKITKTTLYEALGVEMVRGTFVVQAQEQEEPTPTPPQDTEYMYNVSVEKAYSVDHKLYAEGRVSPAKAIPLVVTVKDGQTLIASTETISKEDGSYEFSIDLPNSDRDLEYSVAIELKEQAPNFVTLYSDDFSSKQEYFVKTNVEYDSSGVAKLTNGSRLLKSISELETKEKGIFYNEIRFKKIDENSINKVWCVFDSTGNNLVYRVYCGDNTLSIEYLDENNVKKSKTLASGIATDRWYSLKSVIKLSSNERCFDIYLDDEKIYSNLPVSTNVTNIARVMDAQSTGGTFYIDDANFYEDTTEYLSVEPASMIITDAGNLSIQDFLDAIEGSTIDTVYNILDQYKDKLQLDISAYNLVVDDALINSNIAGKHYSDINVFRKGFNAAIAFALIKESNNGNVIDNISQNVEMLEISVDEAVLTKSLFKEKFMVNLTSASDVENLKALIKNTLIYTALKTTTQFKAKDVIDTYKNELLQIGLSNDFFALNETQAITASKSVFESADNENDVEQMLRNIVGRINIAVNNVKNQYNSGGIQSIEKPSSGVPSNTVINGEQTAKESGYVDLQPSHWAYSAVIALAQKGIMVGVTDSQFEPDTQTTREQFVKIITTSLGLELSKSKITFMDVVDGTWYYPYVATAVENGLINGVTDDKFGVGASISRQDAATIIYRAREKYNLSEGENSSIFVDDEDISDYAKEAVYFLKNCGILNGNDRNEFQPQKALSRAEAAMLLYNILNTKNIQMPTVENKLQQLTVFDRADMLLESLNLKPQFKQEFVTKGEWAEILSKALQLNYGASEEDYFSDIANNEYRDEINILVSQNIIPKSDVYNPDKAITFEQALQNVVYALGWGIKGEYLQTASSLNLTDSISLGYGDVLDRENCIILLYNMLSANYLYDDYNGSMITDNDHTLLGSYYDVVKLRGRVTATNDSALPGYSGNCGEGRIMLDNVVLFTGKTDIEEYLGYNVEVFVQENDDDYTILCYNILSNNKMLVINISDIDYASGFNPDDSYQSRVTPYIRYNVNNRDRTVTLSDDITVWYNNKITQNITNEDFSGENGTVNLIDTNDDGKYDMVSLKRYKAYIVAGYDATNMTVSFKDSRFILDIDSIDNVMIYKNGRLVDGSVIAKNDVLCLYAEKLPDEEINKSEKATVYISTETITGSVTSIDGTENVIEIDGEPYMVADSALSSISLGRKQKFYLDISSIIVKAEVLPDGIDYAYVLGYYKDDFDEGGIVRYLSKSNQKTSLPLAKKVKYTGFDMSGAWVENKTYKSDVLIDILETNVLPRTLIKMEVKDSEIVAFITAKDMSTTIDYKGYNESKFTLDGYNTELPSTNGILTTNYGAVSGTTLMLIDYEDSPEETEFVYYTQSDFSNIVHLFRMVKEVFVYDSNDKLKAGVCVIKVNRGDELVSAWNINTQSVLIVESISQVLNSDDDIVYRIEGYSSGQLVSYDTVNLDVGEMFNTYWSAQSSKTKVSELTTGDVIRVATNSKNQVYTIDILLCTSDFSDTTVGYGGGEYDWIKTVMGPVWKNYDNEIIRLVGEEEKLYQVTGSIYLCDLQRNHISVVGKGIYINDSDTENADYVFIRKNRGVVTEMVIYR